MKTSNMLTLAPAFAFLFACNVVFAQDTTQDEADVWSVVENVWNAEENGDREWPDTFLSENFSGWNKNNPVPRGKSSTKMWNRFGEQLGKMVAHELYPYHIIIAGDTAIAHYLYSSAYKAKDGKMEINNGRYTDTLIRTDDGWKFLAWHGGDDK